MWKPAQRIKHTHLAAEWPDSDTAHASMLFSPIAEGRLKLNHRTWIPAMVPWRATEQGEVTEDVIDWYRRFAEGKPGALVIEATGIRDIPSGPLLRIGHDRYIPGLKKIVQAIHEASDGHTKCFIQLIDFLPIRRRPEKEKFLRRFLVLTDAIYKSLNITSGDEDAARAKLCDMPDEALMEILPAREYENMTRGYRQRVTDTELEEVANLPVLLPELFANAALRAEQAGFDGVELHFAHAYTMASFLSRLNTRTDGYGGAPACRMRLPLEVFAATRKACRDDFIVGCRMLAEENIEGGSDCNDAIIFANAFARAGMDFISFSRGGKFEDAKSPRVGEAIYPYTGQSGYECMPQIISDEQGPFGRNADAVQLIKTNLMNHKLTTPIVLTGGMHVFNQAEQYLQSGAADIIGFARQSLADPDWFTKVIAGQGTAVNLCTYSNYCEGLDQKHKMVTCQLWDRVGLEEKDAKKTPDGKRRTIAPAWDK